MVKKSTKKHPSSKSKINPKTPKSAPAHNPYKILTFVFGSAFFALSILVVVFLLPLTKTHEEQKRLEAFDTLALQYVDRFSETSSDLDPPTDQPLKTRTTVLTGIGLSRDDDLYIDYLVTNFEDHIIQSFQKRRAHFQCQGENRQTILTQPSCGIGTWMDDEVPASEELKTTMKQWNTLIEQVVEDANSTDDEAMIQAIHDKYNAEEQKYIEIYKSELIKNGYPERLFNL